ncbi:L,D-transpeptidase [Aliigemmobacter aestuarii]|uniref:L,D-transpeptidase n=1 Tax=Aliigemmobacter aestuarii TaxID=1445661 RepID=A0A4V6RS13_9RHOB|nr:L,D-transpeptidase [Gemmobacter aestuarii]THD82790.1 L,D-transpeptidase [Gemmobacter aestuarii]
MTRTGLKLATALAALALLSGCVVDPTMQAGSSNAPAKEVAPEDPPPPPQLQFAANYIAKQDGTFAVPQVPVEKVPVNMLRQEVDFPNTEAPGTIIIHPGEKSLHYILNNRRAIRYGIAVGRDGFGWAGEAIVSSRKPWPTWTPPKEMIARDPKLEKWKDGQPGGPTNPLGARALYLTTNGRDYGYRIHGTPDWWSIGRSASSGCFRMINQDVMDLYERVPDGAKVIVLNNDGSRANGLKLPPPQPVKAKATPKPKAQPAVTPDTGAAAPIPTAATGPMSTPAPSVAPAVTPSVTATPAVTAPAVPTPSTGTTTTASPTVAVPAAPAPAAPAATTPTPVVVQPVAPAVTVPAAPAPAPVVIQPAPAAPAPTCAVPLVNGICPQG